MSVIGKVDGAVLLDHQDFLDRVYSNKTDRRDEPSAENRCYKISPQMFDVRTPYAMDSAVENILGIGEKRKRKRKKNKVEETADDPLSSYLESKLKAVLELGKGAGHFLPSLPTREEILSNNRASRNLNNALKPVLCAIENAVSKNPDLHEDFSSKTAYSLSGENFLIPPKSSFYLGQMKDCMKSLINSNEKFDAIVVDPPWTNRYIKRQDSYRCMENHELFSELSPLSAVMKENCFVFVWITNKEKHKRFVTEELFKMWNVDFVTEWYWLKVTRYGQPVASLRTANKKPYEKLIIGRSRLCSSSNSLGKTIFPSELVLISVPCGIHSHKPPLVDLINSVILPNQETHYLELFARNLLPNCTSCGNQVLLLQHDSLFQKL